MRTQTQTQMIQPAADSVRIRDNQRRSRARRKEYLQDLEKRVHKFEQEGVTATIEVQAAAKKVARQNELLRSLLRLKGVSEGEVEGYLAANRGGDGDGNGNTGGRTCAGKNNTISNGMGVTSELQLLALPLPPQAPVPAPAPMSLPSASAPANTQPPTCSPGIGGCCYPSSYPPLAVNTITHLQAQSQTYPPSTTENSQDFSSAASSSTTRSAGGYSSSSSMSPRSSNNDQLYPPPYQPPPQNHLVQIKQQKPLARPPPPPPSTTTIPIPQPPLQPPQPIPQQQHQHQQQQQQEYIPAQPPTANPSNHPPPSTTSQIPTLLPTYLDSHDATSCEVAASIIASMRGHDDAESVRTELGCPPGTTCRVGNMAIFQALDSAEGVGGGV
ncbi:hypothetical protein FQN55_004378 [Onygenales sp. PD_40]|nr:hypothetical protein FQN55_004378 [Onygenales sp. PD_40]